MSIARPVYALGAEEPMSKQLKICRALKVLHGPGITWHVIGDYLVYYTPGDHCGCHACVTYLHQLVEGTHPEGVDADA